MPRLAVPSAETRRPLRHPCTGCHRDGLELYSPAGSHFWRTVEPGQTTQHLRANGTVCDGRPSSGSSAPSNVNATAPMNAVPQPSTPIDLSHFALKSDVDAMDSELRGYIANQRSDLGTTQGELAALQTELTATRARLDAMEATKDIVVYTPSNPQGVNVGRQHFQFERVLRLASRRINVMMVGPAGSGKTTIAENIAKALGVKYYPIPLGPQTTKSDLVGYMAAHGEYIASILRVAFEHGGLVLFDEIDASNPAALLIANGMIANVTAGFPDGIKSKHPNCYFMAAGNTYGRGANEEYSGRAVLDAATLDRFRKVRIDYDWDFVETFTLNREWTRYCQRVSDIVIDLAIKAVVGPRIAIDGGKMLSGEDAFSWDDCVAALFEDMTPRDADKVKEALKAQTH